MKLCSVYQAKPSMCLHWYSVQQPLNATPESNYADMQRYSRIKTPLPEWSYIEDIAIH